LLSSLQFDEKNKEKRLREKNNKNQNGERYCKKDSKAIIQLLTI